MQTNYWPRGLCIYLTSAVSKEIFYEHLNSLIPNFSLDKRELFQQKLPVMDVTFTQAGIYEVTRTLSNQCFRVSLDFPSCHVLKYKLPQLQCIHIIKQNSNWQNFSKRLSSDGWVVFQLQIWHNVPKQIWSGYDWWVSKTFSFFCSIFRLYRTA